MQRLCRCRYKIFFIHGSIKAAASSGFAFNQSHHDAGGITTKLRLSSVG